MAKIPAPDDKQKELIRQGERTIDNLKRLFALLFSFSLSGAALGSFSRLQPALINSTFPTLPLNRWLVHAEMLAVFVITAGVFYHQSAKFLDVRYAKHPLAEAHPWGFALDYLTLVGTVAPFYLMAYSLGPSVTGHVGYFWFFTFYIVLLAQGLLLLVISYLRHSEVVRTQLFGDVMSESEVQRDATLRIYWWVMNSFILLIAVALFALFQRYGSSCPTSFRHGASPTFLFLFGLLAFSRDYLDFRYAWRFVWPIHEDRAPPRDKWPMTWIANTQFGVGWAVIGGVFIVASFCILTRIDFWDFRHWISICK